MGTNISFQILKHPKYKEQIELLISWHIDREYSNYLKSLPKRYYDEDDEDDEYQAFEGLSLNFSDWRGIGQIGCNTKIFLEDSELVKYIVNFWKDICQRYFYEEVALFNLSEVMDEGGCYYFYQGEVTSLYGEDLGFITSYCELAIKRYNEPINLNITGVDKEKILVEITSRKEQEIQLEKNKEIVETFKEGIIAKAKTLLEENSQIKQIFVGGDGGVGKTTFILRYCIDIFFPAPLWCANLFLNHTLVDNETVSLFFWDIMGQSRARFLAKFFANDVDGVILCFDLSRHNSFKSVDELVKMVRKNNQTASIILVGMKADLKERVTVSYKEISELIKEDDIKDYLKVSSKSRLNFDKISNILSDEINFTSLLDESRFKIVKKKLTLLEYLKTYDLQGEEELRSYFGNYVPDEETMQEALKEYNSLSKDELISNLLLYDDFKIKLQKFVEQL